MFLHAHPNSVFSIPVVRHALEWERNLTPKNLAEKCGVDPRTITYWRNGTQPKPEQLKKLAVALGIDPVRIYQALGWLEPGSTTSMEARDGRALAESTVRLLRAIGTGVPDGAAAVLRRALQQRHEVFSWTDMRDVDGHVQVELRDFVGLNVSGGERNGTPDGKLAASLRETYELATRLGPALLEDRPEVIALCQERHQAEAWFWVPRLAATRPPRGRRPIRQSAVPLELPPQVRTVVVVGSRLAGADRIAALLARELGWGHLNTSIEAQRVFGREAGDQRRHAERALWVGEAVLSSELGDGYVIGHGAASTATALIEVVGRRARSCLLVCMSAEPHLVGYARGATRGQADTVLDERGEVADFNDGITAAFTAAQRGYTSEWATQPLRININPDVHLNLSGAFPTTKFLTDNEAALWKAQAAAYRTLAQNLTQNVSQRRPR